MIRKVNSDEKHEFTTESAISCSFSETGCIFIPDQPLRLKFKNIIYQHEKQIQSSRPIICSYGIGV